MALDWSRSALLTYSPETGKTIDIIRGRSSTRAEIGVESRGLRIAWFIFYIYYVFYMQLEKTDTTNILALIPI